MKVMFNLFHSDFELVEVINLFPIILLLQNPKAIIENLEDLSENNKHEIN